uniref:Uncharacterized protein n=1 Tax=Lactuca sativa TaxID=4236 RepID=A0A9R1UYB1_LACSA|nr:hypothetical protein LSAT_V11C700376870 [Lactuca sativa]
MSLGELTKLRAYIFLGCFNFVTKLSGLASKSKSLGYELKELDLGKDTQGGLLLSSEEKYMFVNIVTMDIQIGMTLDVTGKEVGGPGEVEMVMNVSGIKVTLNITNVVSLVTIATNDLNGKKKRRNL